MLPRERLVWILGTIEFVLITYQAKQRRQAQIQLPDGLLTQVV
jgi:hypothetical protein